MPEEKDYKVVKINNKRSLLISTFFFKYDKDLKKNKIITRIIFNNRLKLHDLEFLLNQQTLSIKDFIQNNPKYSYTNSIFHLVIEMRKGTNFTPDLKAFRLFMRYKLGMAQNEEMVFGPTIGILPRLYTKFLSLVSRGYFGLVQGRDYDLLTSYDEALIKISSFKNILNRDNFPEHIIEQLKNN